MSEQDSKLLEQQLNELNKEQERLKCTEYPSYVKVDVLSKEALIKKIPSDEIRKVYFNKKLENLSIIFHLLEILEQKNKEIHAGYKSFFNDEKAKLEALINSTKEEFINNIDVSKKTSLEESNNFKETIDNLKLVKNYIDKKILPYIDPYHPSFSKDYKPYIIENYIIKKRTYLEDAISDKLQHLQQEEKAVRQKLKRFPDKETITRQIADIKTYLQEIENGIFHKEKLLNKTANVKKQSQQINQDLKKRNLSVLELTTPVYRNFVH